MITKKNYVDFLLSSPFNYTATYMVDHLKGVSHDVIIDFLQQNRYTAHHLWELSRSLIEDSAQSYLIIDDSVQDKRYSKAIELVKRQYSGNEHGLVRGIDIVNLVHVSKRDGDAYPID